MVVVVAAPVVAAVVGALEVDGVVVVAAPLVSVELVVGVVVAVVVAEVVAEVEASAAGVGGVSTVSIM